MIADFLGRPIHVGDTVTYPNRVGSEMYCVSGEVERLGESDIVVRRHEDRRLVHVNRLDRVTVTLAYQPPLKGSPDVHG